MKKPSSLGFTLIELMIVVAILGIILAIAIPKFSSLVDKSREGTTKGNLGSIRSALSVYYSECEALYPSDNLTSLVIGNRFIPILPVGNLPSTKNNIGHGGGPISGVIVGAIPAAVDDVADNTSVWLYDNSPVDQNYGRVIINCSHSDSYGDKWTSF